MIIIDKDSLNDIAAIIRKARGCNKTAYDQLSALQGQNQESRNIVKNIKLRLSYVDLQLKRAHATLVATVYANDGDADKRTS